MRIGETPGDQVDLAHAAMPGAEQQAPPPRIKAVARNGGAAHLFPQHEKPGRAGQGDIATAGANVSALCARFGAILPCAADLKFLHRPRQTRSGTSNRKAALES